MAEDTLRQLNDLTKRTLALRKSYLPVLERYVKEEKRKQKTKQLHAFYLEPVPVSKRFIRFFKLLPEHPYSRVFCYRKVFEYLKKHQLLTNEDIMIIDDIQWLFQGTPTLSTMDVALEHHFISLE